MAPSTGRKRRESKDTAMARPTDGTTEPMMFDVVFGRGRGNQQRAGNIRYQEIVDANQSRYFQATSRHEMVMIAQQVMLEVTEHGRFLKYDKDSLRWLEVSEVEARQKVAQSLQYRRRHPSENPSVSTGSMGREPATGLSAQGDTSLTSTVASLQNAESIVSLDAARVISGVQSADTEPNSDAVSVASSHHDPTMADPEFLSLIRALSQGDHLGEDDAKSP